MNKKQKKLYLTILIILFTPIVAFVMPEITNMYSSSSGDMKYFLSTSGAAGIGFTLFILKKQIDHKIKHLPEDKIEEYKKLIREHGVAEATSTLDESGIVYSENFTESHVSDPIFSRPRLMHSKNSVHTTPLKLGFYGSESTQMTSEKFSKTKMITSTQLMSFIDGFNISMELGTGDEMKKITPNVTSHSTY